MIIDRVERLAPNAIDVLRLAAIVGAEFELEVLDLALARPPRPTNDPGTLAILERAVAAGLLVEPPGTATLPRSRDAEHPLSPRTGSTTAVGSVSRALSAFTTGGH